MRPRRQGERRAQLVRAARQVLLAQGAVGVRVKDIAERAGLAPSSVLYYYPDVAELLLEVMRQAMDRFTEERARAVRELAGPREQLRRAIHLGVPTGPDDEESRLLYELDALTGTSRAFAILSSTFFDRQADLYSMILVNGEARGELTLAASAETIAKGLVALEDGLGLQVVLAHEGLDGAAAEEILLEYARAMTGLPIGQSDSPSRGNLA